MSTARSQSASLRAVRDALEDEKPQSVELGDGVVEAYALDAFARNFSLMTAGYRDRLDPADAYNPELPFNALTVAIMAEAKARVFERRLAAGETPSVHVGGEVRPHTQLFIKTAARVYAAHGFEVHLRTPVATTPIWYSSFGVFFERLQSGDNFTASHSAFFKGGWKPMDGRGQQLLAQEQEIVAEVRAIVARREPLALGAFDGARVHRDFDVDDAYVAYQRTVLGQNLIRELQEAHGRGFRVAYCPVGGSMGATTRRLFARLGLHADAVRYFLDAEDPEFHRIGHAEGEIGGVDPCDRRVYRNVGAQQRLASGEADIVVLSDPDGDRVKVVTTAPARLAGRARDLGIEIEEGVIPERCIVYLTPNQLYLVITAFRIAALRESGDLERYDWFVATTFPTSKSIEELARAEGLRGVQVPVGFKFLGGLCADVEAQAGRPAEFVTNTGERVALGATPRAIILCEESGGATLGGSELLADRTGERGMLALREKDGMQIILFSIALAARLHRQGGSFLEFYCESVERHAIRSLHYQRFDVRLYDEALRGDAFHEAQRRGNARKEEILAYWSGLVERHASGWLSLDALRDELDARRPPGAAAFPAATRACSTGDGILIEFDAGLRFLLRASGTEALLRYYIEGTTADAVEDLGKRLIELHRE